MEREAGTGIYNRMWSALGLTVCFERFDFPFQQLSSMKEEAYRAGQEAARQQAPPTITSTLQQAPPSDGVSMEQIQTKVKVIMNQAYQTMAMKFKAKKSFETKEILSILVASIKVSL